MYARHWKRRMLSVAVAIAMVVACIVALDATCAYAGPISGTHRNLDRSKTSDVLIIGDSRIEMLAELNNVTTKKASYNATVGAHYIYNNAWVTGYWANKPMVIGCPQYLKQQQAIVRNCLKRHGSCKVVIVATVNYLVPEGPRLAKGLVTSPVIRSLCLAHRVLTAHCHRHGLTRSPC